MVEEIDGAAALLKRPGMIGSHTMNSPTKSKSRLAQALVLIAPASVAFYTVSRGPSFDQFRALDIVLVLATGLCIGVAFSLLVLRRKE